MTRDQVWDLYLTETGVISVRNVTGRPGHDLYNTGSQVNDTVLTTPSGVTNKVKCLPRSLRAVPVTERVLESYTFIDSVLSLGLQDRGRRNENRTEA